MTPDLARALASLTTGIYVLTVADGETGHGMSASWVTQVSGEPPLVLTAVGRKHLSHDLIERAGWFGINVLGRRSRHLEDYFYSEASRHRANLDKWRWEPSRHGVPLLCDALVNLECRVSGRLEVGDRTLFVASIEHVVWRDSDVPLTSQDLEYVFVGEVVHRDKRRGDGGGAT
ncbi:MAG TPA: flavin reductase family protein [Candidatus Acidoferrales bacterium]|nr:flavin reductase family protein [Candidatus Acidoferrales bacterium]